MIAAGILFSGCADERATGWLPSARAASAPRTPAAAPAPADEARPAIVDVTGVIATDLEEPVEGRMVVIVDALGERREGVTDHAGAFAIDAVAAPYDLAVDGGDLGHLVFLGIRRADPRIEVPARRAPAPPSQRVRVALRADACPPDGSVTIVTASPSGGGSATVACEGASADPILVEVQHAWRARSVSEDERIVVHVLASDEARTSFAHARAGEIPARPGETADVGIVDPAPIEAAGPFVFGAADGPLEGWAWTTEVFVDVTGTGSGFVLEEASAPQAITRVPLVPGGSSRVVVSATHPRSDGRGGFHRWAQAWSGALGLSSAPPLLRVEAGPDVVWPEPDGEIGGARDGFAWRSTRRALATLAVADVANSVLRFRVHTDGDEVPLRRLALLGVPKLLSGDHVLELSTSEGQGVDDACSPDPATRRRRDDRGAPGGATSLRTFFRVTE